MCDTARRGAQDAFCCFHVRVTLHELNHVRRFIHAQRTVIYGVVIVSRNIERTNQNDGFKLTALEYVINTEAWWQDTLIAAWPTQVRFPG